LTIECSSAWTNDLLTHSLPDELESLTFTGCDLYTDCHLYKLPHKILYIKLSSRDLHWDGQYKSFPPNLEVLILDFETIDDSLPELPATLENLELSRDCGYNNSLGKLPSALKRLTLGKSFKQDLGALPRTFKELTLSIEYPFKICAHEGLAITFY
jgi:FNIP Repeat